MMTTCIDTVLFDFDGTLVEIALDFAEVRSDLIIESVSELLNHVDMCCVP
ncbi:MAG: hypothetical protein U9Q78_07525 [Chloroflexota bacterium]|nr:hypothetical protein [Chloroflexota bacterium]